MTEAFILKSCLKYPGRIVHNDELEDRISLNHGIIERLTGIKHRYYVNDTESLHSIATDASADVITSSGIDPSEIDLIIFYTEVPPSYMEDSLLRRRFYELSPHMQYSLTQRSIGVHCECFNMAGSCVVFISALQIAASLIR